MITKKSIYKYKAECDLYKDNRGVPYTTRWSGTCLAKLDKNGIAALIRFHAAEIAAREAAELAGCSPEDQAFLKEQERKFPTDKIDTQVGRLQLLADKIVEGYGIMERKEFFTWDFVG